MSNHLDPKKLISLTTMITQFHNALADVGSHPDFNLLPAKARNDINQILRLCRRVVRTLLN